MVEQPDKEQNQLMTWSMVILAAFALGASLYFTRKVMVPFVLSVFIASMVSPVVDYVAVRLRAPHYVAVSAALLVVLGIVAIFGLIMMAAMQTVVDVVRQYSEEIMTMISQLIDKIHQWTGEPSESNSNPVSELQTQLFALATKAIGTATSLMTNGVLIFIFCAFLLAGRTSQTKISGVYAEIDEKVRKYLAIKVMISAVTGILVWMLLYVLGLKSTSFLFGVLTFLLNFIPSLGSIIATLLPIPVAYAQFESILWIILVIALPGGVQLLMGNVIEPKLQGTGLKLHPVTILFSLAFWGLLWGIPGMVLAVPMTAILRIVLMQFDTTQPIGNLLAGELPRMDLKDGTA